MGWMERFMVRSRDEFGFENERKGSQDEGWKKAIGGEGVQSADCHRIVTITDHRLARGRGGAGCDVLPRPGRHTSSGRACPRRSAPGPKADGKQDPPDQARNRSILPQSPRRLLRGALSLRDLKRRDPRFQEGPPAFGRLMYPRRVRGFCEGRPWGCQALISQIMDSVQPLKKKGWARKAHCGGNRSGRVRAGRLPEPKQEAGRPSFAGCPKNFPLSAEHLRCRHFRLRLPCCRRKKPVAPGWTEDGGGGKVLNRVSLFQERTTWRRRADRPPLVGDALPS